MNITITILSPDLVPLGLVNKFTALTWTSRTTTFGGFELWCPMLPENSELLKADNLVWIGGDEVGVIETIQKTTDEQGYTLQVSGRFIESWLERRIIWGQYSTTEVVSNHLRNLVTMNAISPSDSKRKIPHLTLAVGQSPLGPSISFSDSYSNLWTTALDLANANSLFLRVKADVPGRVLYFTVLKGTDRSIEQTSLPGVILSTDLSDILTDSYTMDATSWCDMALVAGAGEGAERKTSVVNGSLSGLSRRELFVDARDLQDHEDWPTVTTVTTFILDEDAHKVQIVTKVEMTNPTTGKKTTTTSTEEKVDETAKAGVVTSKSTTQVPIDKSVYDGMLQERGKSKLLEVPLIESFDASIRMYGARAYEYGVDYSIGDRITMQDKNLAVQISTEISEAQQTWDENGYSVSLVLGTSAPTITQLLKRKE